MLGRFQDQEGRALADEQAIAVEIEGTATAGAGGLETIETDEDKLGQGLESTNQNAIGQPGGDEIGPVSNGIRATGAGVGQDDRVSGKAERLLDIEDLLLGQISGGLAEKMSALLFEHVTEEVFAEGHAACRGCDRKREFSNAAGAVPVKQSGLGECLARSGNGETGGPGQPAESLGGFTEQGRKRGAGGVMTTATAGVEKIERGLSIAAGDKRIPRVGKASAQGRYRAHSGDDDAGFHGLLQDAAIDGPDLDGTSLEIEGWVIGKGPCSRVICELLRAGGIVGIVDEIPVAVGGGNGAEDDDGVVDIEAGEIVEPDEGGRVGLEIADHFVVKPCFGRTGDRKCDGHVSGAEIDGPSKTDVGLERSGMSCADFAKTGIAGEDNPVVSGKRGKPDGTFRDAADAVGEFLGRQRFGVGLEPGEFPELDGGADHDKAVPRVFPFLVGGGFGLDLAIDIVPDGLIGEGKRIGVVAEGTWLGRGGWLVGVQGGKQKSSCQKSGGDRPNQVTTGKHVDKHGTEKGTGLNGFSGVVRALAGSGYRDQYGCGGGRGIRGNRRGARRERSGLR